jgi:putative hydrolase of the HAD superfamily
VLPVLAIGGHAIHIPYHITWDHERIDHAVEHPQFRSMEKLNEVVSFLHTSI